MKFNFVNFVNFVKKFSPCAAIFFSSFPHGHGQACCAMLFFKDKGITYNIVNMKKKTIYVTVGVVALVIVAGVAFRAYQEERIALPGVSQPGASPAPTSATRAEVPSNIKIPEPGEEVSKGVAAPERVAPASDSPLTDAKSREFTISAENNAYSPNQIIVGHMDVITINFTAKGKAYDMTIPDYGLKRTVNAGESVKLQFQADQVGKFTFYCDICGGLESGTKGTIIVVPK